MKIFETLKNVFTKHIVIKVLALVLAVLCAIVIHA